MAGKGRPRRITPAEAVALFRRHRLRPVTHIHLMADSTGAFACLHGVLLVDRVGWNDANILIECARSQDAMMECEWLALTLGLDRDYSAGLGYGFSDPYWTPRVVEDLADKPWCTARFKEGFADGWAIRKRLKLAR